MDPFFEKLSSFDEKVRMISARFDLYTKKVYYLSIMDIKRVIVNTKAERNLLKVPKHVVLKLISWIESVTENGLNYTVRSNLLKPI